LRAIISSPYLHVSIACAGICFPLWWGSQEWSGIALGAIPNILGFSIGAFAVILSFGQGALESMKDRDEAKSRYLGLIASFVHFIIIQSMSLVVSILGKAWPSRIIGFIGTTLALYAILLAVAASFRLFRLARVYNQMPQSHLKGD
jgi:hypothetical protein